ncbi:hypothetical protein [Ruania alba]|uniref:Uncharacterized protein n=1 Tax=Ruania alba TaxID=648782 RepID=A0A1H5DTL4_9MICO|nr:hypothetical protein [Ruania alba]SED82178.1 hypothetical protein SAMN04488554_0788 [Ruania alba]
MYRFAQIRSRAILAASLSVALAAVAFHVGSTSPARADVPVSGDAPGDEAPTDSSTVAEWEAWAEALEIEANTTDWAADSAARGCELVSIDIRHTTVPESEGAPDGLTVPIVERTEDCTAPATLSQQDAPQSRTDSSLSTAASACASTSGPGRICLSRSGSYVTSSFTYYGSSSPNGFIRIYKRSSSSGCGTGSTLATGSHYTYSYGETHSVSAYAGYGNYSASFWRKLSWGHTNWGTVCDTL